MPYLMFQSNRSQLAHIYIYTIYIIYILIYIYKAYNLCLGRHLYTGRGRFTVLGMHSSIPKSTFKI